MKNQSGMALVVSLAILTILTIIALTAASGSLLQLRMANNSQQQNIAFQTAESGFKRWLINPSETAFTATIGSEISGTTSVVQVQPNAEFERCNAGFSLMLETRRYICYDVVSTGKACPQGAACDPLTADGNARARHVMGFKAPIAN